jgi:hypothetical protein
MPVCLVCLVYLVCLVRGRGGNSRTGLSDIVCRGAAACERTTKRLSRPDRQVGRAAPDTADQIPHPVIRTLGHFLGFHLY